MALNQFPRRSFVGSSTLQTFTGNGTQSAFTLSSAQTQNECFVFVNDVAQVPGVDFTVNGTTLTFTLVPPNNAEIIIRGFGVPAPVTTVSDGSVTAAKLATGAIEAKLGYTPVSPSQLSTEVNNLIAGAPGALNTLDELAAALGDDANYAATITNALAAKANTSSLTPTAVSDQSNTSTGYFDLPSGTTAQRPSSPPVGATRFNTTNGSIEFFDGARWVATNLIPSISSISGVIYAGETSTLTLSLSNTTDTVTVRFSEAGSTIADVQNTLVTSGSVSVSVPAAVFNQTLGDTIVVSVLNSDGTLSSNSVTRTVSALPSGGSITRSGNFRIHTFTSSGTLTVPSGFSATAEYLVVAGGGSGGVDNGAGGGAGGLLTGSTSITTNSYSVIVGAGGASRPGSADDGPGNNGSNSSALGFTAIGGSGGTGWTNAALPPGSSSYSGGSGAGQSSSTSGTNSIGIGIGTSGQGNNGGSAVTGFSGGGGGRGSVGGNASSGQLGWGGLGFSSSISGSSVTYAAGGDGGFDFAGGSRSGSGSGRNGVTKQLTEAGEPNSPANTGHGGHGSNHNDENSGGGGSGIVIIRYTV